MPARIPLDWRIEELFDFGERNDFIELTLNLEPGHAEDRAVQKDVFAAGEFGMKASAHFEEAGHPAFRWIRPLLVQ